MAGQGSDLLDPRSWYTVQARVAAETTRAPSEIGSRNWSGARLPVWIAHLTSNGRLGPYRSRSLTAAGGCRHVGDLLVFGHKVCFSPLFAWSSLLQKSSTADGTGAGISANREIEIHIGSDTPFEAIMVCWSNADE
jgi:hypothetical protein